MIMNASITRSIFRVSRIACVKSSVRPSLLVLRSNFSVDPTPKPDSSDVSKKRIFDASYFHDIYHEHKTPILAAGSIVTVVGVSKFLYFVGDTFLSLSAGSALYYGFSVGAAATVCTAVGAYIVENSFRIEPEAAVQLAMAQVRKNVDLMKILGYHIAPSEAKTYTMSNSGFGIIGAVPKLIHPKIQISFSLVGSNSPALVSAVFTKKGLFGQECEYVGVDWTTPTGANLNLTLMGEDSKFTMRRPIKEHASFIASRATSGKFVHK